jgi:hypothetical protein
MILVRAVLKLMRGHFAIQPHGTDARRFGTSEVEIDAGRSNNAGRADEPARTPAVFGVIFHLQYFPFWVMRIACPIIPPFAEWVRRFAARLDRGERRVRSVPRRGLATVIL